MLYSTKQNGFTLIELMVYLAVFVIVFGILISFIVWVYQASARIQVLKELQTNCQGAMEAVLYQIRGAESIYSPTTISSQLSLFTFSHLPAGETFTHTDIFLCDKRLCLKKESAQPLALTKENVEVSGLQFQEVIGGSGFVSVQVSFTLEPLDDSSQAQLVCSSAAGLRNY